MATRIRPACPSRVSWAGGGQTQGDGDGDAQPSSATAPSPPLHPAGVAGRPRAEPRKGQGAEGAPKTAQLLTEADVLPTLPEVKIQTPSSLGPSSRLLPSRPRPQAPFPGGPRVSETPPRPQGPGGPPHRPPQLGQPPPAHSGAGVPPQPSPRVPPGRAADWRRKHQPAQGCGESLPAPPWPGPAQCSQPAGWTDRQVGRLAVPQDHPGRLDTSLGQRLGGWQAGVPGRDVEAQPEGHVPGRA